MRTGQHTSAGASGFVAHCGDLPLQGVQDWQAVATVMREVVHGLVYMHQSGCIHRDLKAANILVAFDGRVCLAGALLKLKSMMLPSCAHKVGLFQAAYDIAAVDTSRGVSVLTYQTQPL